MKKEHEILFEPFKIGEDIHDYYVERAKNHMGLIIPGMVTC